MTTATTHGSTTTPRSSSAVTGAALILATASLLFTATGCPDPIEVPPPPETRQEVVSDDYHGVRVDDPYRWLEEQDSDEVRSWIAAQNEYAAQIMDTLPGREEVRDTLAALRGHDSFGLPRVRNGRYYYAKRSQGDAHAIIYQRNGRDGAERVLVDPNTWSEDKSKSTGIVSIAPDGSLLLFRERDRARDAYAVRFFDLDRGVELEDRLPEGRYFWIRALPDGQGVLYTRLEEDGAGRLYYHELGRPNAEDRLLWGAELGGGEAAVTMISADGHYVVIHVFHGSVGPTDLYLLDRRSGKTQTIIEGEASTTVGRVLGGRLYLETDRGAESKRVMVAELAEPTPDKWRELIPVRRGASLDSLTGAGGKLFLKYIEDVRSRVLAFDTEGNELGEIKFDALGTVGEVYGMWDEEEAFFVFSSFHIPTTIYRYDTARDEREVWAQPEIPVDPDDYNVKQAWATSRDGTQVPLFVVHRKGLLLNGRNPTLVFAYGAFGMSQSPEFSHAGLAWLDRGGVFVIVGARGGGEFGEDWHEAGRRENKIRTVEDIIGAAEWLIAEGYANPQTIGLESHSLGALAATAAMNERPELFRAVIAAAPITDMLRYHRFGVGQFFVEELGSADDREAFFHLRALSPYHNVEDGVDYPAAVFLVAGADSRIPAFHAFKMVARLQDASRSGLPVLLRYRDAGIPQEVSPVDEQVEVEADLITFMNWILTER